MEPNPPSRHAGEPPGMGVPFIHASDEDPPREPPKLMLAPARGQELDGPLGWLAKRLLLDVYGRSLMTRCAAMEVKIVAVMLTINFLFDLAVWSMLWNMVLYRGHLVVGVWTAGALFCGLLFAAIILIYERQFMTADMTGPKLKLVFPVAVRVLVIAMAVGITTQPFEVLVFNGPIQRRVHEESVRLKALSHLRALEEAEKRQTVEGHKGTVEEQRLTEAKEIGNEARTQANLLKGRAQAAQDEVRKAESAVAAALSQLRRARTRRQAVNASSYLAAARERLGKAQTTATEAAAKVNAGEEDAKTAEERRGQAEQVLTQMQNINTQEVKRLQYWIAQIRTASPGNDIVVENSDQSPKWTFQDTEYDFFQRLGVINDLFYGRPPRWFDATPENRAKLTALYSLSDPDAKDTFAMQRLASDAETFKWSYRAVIGIALVIPLLLLALKMLLPTDLRLYYSRDAQIKAGNYEILRFEVNGNEVKGGFKKGDGDRNGNGSSS